MGRISLFVGLNLHRNKAEKSLDYLPCLHTYFGNLQKTIFCHSREISLITEHLCHTHFLKQSLNIIGARDREFWKIQVDFSFQKVNKIGVCYCKIPWSSIYCRYISIPNTHGAKAWLSKTMINLMSEKQKLRYLSHQPQVDPWCGGSDGLWKWLTGKYRPDWRKRNSIFFLTGFFLLKPGSWGQSTCVQDPHSWELGLGHLRGFPFGVKSHDSLSELEKLNSACSSELT